MFCTGWAAIASGSCNIRIDPASTINITQQTTFPSVLVGNCFTTSSGSATINGKSINYSIIPSTPSTLTVGSISYNSYNLVITPSPPSAPNSVTLAISASSTTITTTVNQGNNNGNPVNGYYYAINGTSYGAFISYPSTPNPFTFTFTGSYGSSYYVNVIVVNAVGNSEATTSNTVMPYTFPSTPTASAVGGNAKITVTFATSSNNGSTITAYRLCIGITNPPDTSAAAVSAGNFTNVYRAGDFPVGGTYTHDLTQHNGASLTNRVYYIIVQAFNAALYSDSVVTSATPYTVPSAPGVVDTSFYLANSYTIRADFFGANSNGSTITGYQYSLDSGLLWSSIIVPTAVSNYFYIDIAYPQILYGQTYSVQLRAYSNAGAGQADTFRSSTTGIRYLTPYTVPSAPNSVTLSISANSTTITTTVNQGNNNGNAVNGYYYAINGTSYGAFISYPSAPNPFTFTFTGSYGSSYYINVIVVNAAGNSSATTSNTVTLYFDAVSGTGVITASSLSLTGYISSFNINNNFINSITNPNLITTNNTNSYATGPYSGNLVSVNTSHIISSGIGFTINSDKRIKKNIETLSSTESLQIVKDLKPCKFQYIDYMKGSISKYGYLAQEVEAVLPNVVNQNSSYIPNFFEVVEINNQTKIILHEKNTESLTIGTKVQFYDIYNNILYREVQEIIDEKVFLVSEPFITDVETLFLYGQLVEDFRSIDTDQINTILLSALQACNKKIEKQERELDDLEKLLENLRY